MADSRRKEFLYKHPKTLLNKGTGFLSDYSHSLNPYTGCSFACSYCYVRQMPVSLFRGKEWGTWVDIKQEAAALLRKELRRAKAKGTNPCNGSNEVIVYQVQNQKFVNKLYGKLHKG